MTAKEEKDLLSLISAAEDALLSGDDNEGVACVVDAKRILQKRAGYPPQSRFSKLAK